MTSEIYQFGTIKEHHESESYYLVDAEGAEYFEATENVELKLIPGDKVRIKVTKEEERFGDAIKFAIVPQTTVPAIEKTHVGMVTNFYEKYTVFDSKFLLINSTISEENLELTPRPSQKYKFIAIESSQNVNGTLYGWRIVKILEKSDILPASRIVFDDVSIRLRKKRHNIEIISATIKNVSNADITLVNYYLNEGASHFVQLDSAKNRMPIVIPRNNDYKVSLKIFPRSVVKEESILTADFEMFSKEIISKQCKISIDVQNPQIILPPRQQADFELIRFGNYFVPDTLSLIDLTRSNIADLEKLLNNYEFLDNILSKDNYLDKMHFGVYFEESAIGIAFAKYHIKETCFEKEGECFKLQVKDVSEKRPSILIGDTIEATTLDRLYTYKGKIEKIEQNSILVNFPRKFLERQGNKFMIDFNFSRKIYRQFHHALDTITSSGGLGYEFLFPENENFLKHPNIPVYLENETLVTVNENFEWFDKKLNNYQKEAVVNALRGECRPRPFIIFGPPGTGKTMTVIELIKQLLFFDEKARLIVAAPSNSAANSFTQALVNFSKSHGPDYFVRFVSHNQIEKNLIPPGLLKYCAKIDTSSISANESTDEQDCSVKSFKKYDIMKRKVVISTLSCLGTMMKIGIQEHFTHVIIDEAGQCIEPETLIPFTLLKKETGNVILCGDPQQLGPQISSQYSKQLNLCPSLLERLLTTNKLYSQSYGPDGNEYNRRFVVKLKKNYRSVPSILHIYNDFFYKNELEGILNDEDSPEANLLSIFHDKKVFENLWNQEELNEKCGVYFMNVVKGKNSKVRESCSWYNQAELNAVSSFVHLLNGKLIALSDVGLITPYSLQVKKFKQRLQILNNTDLKIGTVEEFQGQERHIILVSTVRTETAHLKSDKYFDLGFLNCPHRMNVLISRARSLLVIFGNGSLLEKDHNWNKLIEYTKQNKTYATDVHS